MSDESSRSARPYGQRRNDGAPTWWAALDRVDLPDDVEVPAAHRRWYEDAHPVAPVAEVATSRAEPAPAKYGWLIFLVVALAVAVILGFAWGADSSFEVLTVTLLIGIPVGLAAVVTILLARRNS